MKTSEPVTKTYTIKTYTVKYVFPENAEKVLITPEDTVYRKGETITLKTVDEMNAEGTIATDYVFAGWYNERDFTGKKVKTLTTTTPQDIELYGMCVYGEFVNKNLDIDLRYYEDKTAGLYTFVFGSNVDRVSLEYKGSRDDLSFCFDFSEIKKSMNIGRSSGLDILIESTPKMIKSLSKIIFPPNCTIKENTFTDYDSMKEVIFTGDITIENGSFCSCDELKKIVFEGKNATLEARVFISCYSLTDVTLPENLTAIPNYMFMCCESLQTITLPKTVTEIGESAFLECTSLNTIDLSNVTKIGYCAFNECAFTEIILPECIEEIGVRAFSSCKQLQTVQLPDNLEIIPDGIFSYCTALKNVTIPASVKQIDNKAFYNCSSENFTEITIPTNVEYIGERAFYWCENLEKITFEDPNNWYYTTSEEDAKNKTGGTAVELDLSNLKTKDAVAEFNVLSKGEVG